MLLPKLFTCMKDYSKEQFFKDLIAGIIVAIIALPLSIALGIASGVTPEKGIITAIIGGFFVSLLGGSRVQIGGPTGAFVVIILGIIQKYGLDGLIFATLMAGMILIFMGVFKLGSLVEFIPYPITTGFTSGIAIIIFSTQVKDFLGLNIENIPSEFIAKWMVYLKNLGQTNMQALMIGFLTILIIVLFPKINRKVPSTLIAIFVATLLAKGLNLEVSTIQTQFGEISGSIPSIHFPTFDFSKIEELIIPAVAIAVLGSVESLLSAVVADGMIGGNHRSNMELVGQGVANIFSALFGGIPVTGAIARTAANVKNGARTPISGIVHSITLFFMMIILMPYVKYIPMASLAGILIVVSYNMGEWDEFKQLNKCPKSDALVFIVTFLLTIIFDLVVAIEVGMVLSAFLFMKRMANITQFNYMLGEDNSSSDQLRLKEEFKISSDIDFYEIIGPFFFGAADKFIKTVRSTHKMPKILVLDLKQVPIIDATGYSALCRLYEMCTKSNTRLVFMQMQEEPYKILENYGFVDLLGRERFCDNIDEVVEITQKLSTAA
ncbi:STAS domain-containing protein [Lutibacter sp. B2]|nr:STAS domain-containing protein [Lutibacter sp. B2]